MQEDTVTYHISKSKAKNKKLAIKILYKDDNGKQRQKTFNIGQEGCDDYPTACMRNIDTAESVKEVHLKRLRKTIDESDHLKKSWWGKNLLWNKPTIEESIEDIKQRYGANITYEI